MSIVINDKDALTSDQVKSILVYVWISEVSISDAVCLTKGSQ